MFDGDSDAWFDDNGGPDPASVTCMSAACTVMWAACFVIDAVAGGPLHGALDAVNSVLWAAVTGIHAYQWLDRPWLDGPGGEGAPQLKADDPEEPEAVYRD